MLKNIFNKHITNGEEIYFTFRPHVKEFFNQHKKLIIFGLILPLIIIFISITRNLIVTLIVTTILILCLTRFLYLLYIWYRNAWLLTNLGLLKVSWNGPYVLNTTRIEFPDIAGFGFASSGIFQHFTGKGNVQVELVNGSVIEFENQRSPRTIVKMLSELRLENLRQRKWVDEDGLKELMTGIVSKYLGEMGTPIKNQKMKEDDPEDIVIEVIQKGKWKA